jgi:hypothetical protein
MHNRWRYGPGPRVGAVAVGPRVLVVVVVVVIVIKRRVS